MQNGDNPEFARLMANHYEKWFETALADYRDELFHLKKLPLDLVAYWIDGEPRTVEDRISDVEFFIAFEQDAMR